MQLASALFLERARRVPRDAGDMGRKFFKNREFLESSDANVVMVASEHLVAVWRTAKKEEYEQV